MGSVKTPYELMRAKTMPDNWLQNHPRERAVDYRAMMVIAFIASLIMWLPSRIVRHTVAAKRHR